MRAWGIAGALLVAGAWALYRSTFPVRTPEEQARDRHNRSRRDLYVRWRGRRMVVELENPKVTLTGVLRAVDDEGFVLEVGKEMYPLAFDDVKEVVVEKE